MTATSLAALASLAPLPGHAAPAPSYVDVRTHLDARAPGTYAKLSYTQRVLAENILRRAPAEELAPALAQIVEGRADRDIPFYPARVVLQDLLGTPALVDLAGLRDAIAEAGGDPSQVNPAVPTRWPRTWPRKRGATPSASPSWPGRSAPSTT